jgi:CCR4-NOT transcription complex subunit 1
VSRFQFFPCVAANNLKADAIISANYGQFLQIVATTQNKDHEDLDASFVATIVDRLIQEHPPNFDQSAEQDLRSAMQFRYTVQVADGVQDTIIPTEVLAALYLTKLLNDTNPLVLSIKSVGPSFTSDEEACTGHLRKFGKNRLDEEQIAGALLYTAISRTPSFSTVVLLGGLRNEVSLDFNWQLVIEEFDRPELRISQQQFLDLYEAFRPLAVDGAIDIQLLWGGDWKSTETQLSFINAVASLVPEQLDATTIPGLEPSFTLDDYAESDAAIRERAEKAVRYTLVSVAALSALFRVALGHSTASESVEAKRLFQEVVLPNLDIFLVSAFSVRPWSELAVETINNLFERYIFKYDPNYDFVLDSLWRKDKKWVASRLIEAHAKAPLELQTIMDHCIRHGWLDDLILLLNGFGLDLTAMAHAQGILDLEQWAQALSVHHHHMATALLTFLNIKAHHELAFQREGQEHPHTVMLQVKTVSALLEILESILPKEPSPELIVVQRACITAYPRLINFGEGFDDIINENGKTSNSLPEQANAHMENHYKRMYSNEVQVRNVVEALDRYKHSRDPFEQDVFACMIHGLFDEYSLYGTYPLEALATTAVLFGGIISHKLISDLPLEIGLGMILEAVRDHTPEQSMYKFGLQALMQLFSRLREWPGFCKQLLQVQGLIGTEAFRKAEEVVREQQEEMPRSGTGVSQNELVNGGAVTNGHITAMLAVDSSSPPFNSLNVDPPAYEHSAEPSGDIQEKVQFVLNNISGENLESKFSELKEAIDENHQQWFAEHLVEERAKMQPNYHKLYLDLVKLFGRKSLWSEVLRETFVSVFRMLNAESTMHSAVERTHLKNLGGWLGSLTLARDKPIKYKHIAFKPLLLEAFDTQRLIIVIPFVCKVLVQGQYSTVFKPPNPWLMDIIHLLMELYHHAELKLNLKFEIEVLCKDLKLDHKTIEPSSELMTRAPPVEEPTEPLPQELMPFENLELGGLDGSVAGGRFSHQEITSSIPDLGPLLVYPPVNDMVNQGRLQEIVRTAITRAVHEIISPVVERSVTIAAISTAQMIHKDFATEPNELRVRSAAINMVKKTAGSLALVTSKEPLRASMTNYIRALSTELPQGLPEGTIIMCVNSNLDLACSQVEKKAEERAVPEIEEMIEPELENRRIHRSTMPDRPYVDPGLSRWSWTIPNPYKLQPSVEGLNLEQMAIYEEFARQPRAPSLGGTTHVASSSDATRSIANDILQDYPAVPSLPTPAEPPAMPHLNQSSYPQPNAGMSNGRIPALPMDPRGLLDRVQKTLQELERVAKEAPEKHYTDLPRPHPVLDVLDALYSLFIRSSQGPESFDIFMVDHICSVLFNGVDEELVVESLVHVLENICRIGGRTANRVAVAIAQLPNENLLSVPLAISLIRAEMVEWQRIDSAASKALAQRKEGSLEFLSALIDAVLLNDQPTALYADFAKSLEVAWQWINEEPTLEVGQALKEKLNTSGLPEAVGRTGDERFAARQGQMDYVFEEWVHLCNNPNVSDKAPAQFISQMYKKQLINSKDDLCMFLRLSIDSAVDRFEAHLHNNGSINDAYIPIDSLAKLIAMLVKAREEEGEVKGDKAAFFELTLSLVVLVLNHHHVTRGEHFNQKVFFRLFSTMLCEFRASTEDLTEAERQQITMTFAETFLKLRPWYFPGFIFGWLSLIAHRDFLPMIMKLPNESGWKPYSRIVESLMSYLGELLKPMRIAGVTRDIYRGVLKVLYVLQHDYPEFVAANHSRLGANIPSHCVQFHNLILNANPIPSQAKMPDPMQPGLKVDRIDDIHESPDSSNDAEAPLRQTGLFDVVDQALQRGPSEDAVAHIAHEIQRNKGHATGTGCVSVNVDVKLINSLVVYVGMYAVARAAQKSSPTYVQASPDAALLTMLVHEVRPEARYHLINSVVNQLRFGNAHTHYFSQALLELFGSDHNDQEESDIRQQITRILLERLISQWPQPWGLIITTVELIKNEKYMFFDLPFIKASPEVRLFFDKHIGNANVCKVADRFAALIQPPRVI